MTISQLLVSSQYKKEHPMQYYGQTLHKNWEQFLAVLPPKKEVDRK